jgi:L-threonylcarbamoyladenylate synthase
MNIFEEKNISVSNIVQALQEGKTLVYPTETCYGLGCDATNADALSRVFAIKNRQKNKPVLVIFPDRHMAMQYVVWDKTLDHIADTYWPGPLTVIAKARAEVSLPLGVVAENGTLAFRISSHHLVEKITRELGKPLVSTSANIASLESPYDIAAIKNMFDKKQDKPDIVIDAGDLPHHAPSTVVAIDDVGGVTVLRQGEVVINNI